MNTVKQLVMNRKTVIDFSTKRGRSWNHLKCTNLIVDSWLFCGLKRLENVTHNNSSILITIIPLVSAKFNKTKQKKFMFQIALFWMFYEKQCLLPLLLNKFYFTLFLWSTIGKNIWTFKAIFYQEKLLVQILIQLAIFL